MSNESYRKILESPKKDAFESAFPGRFISVRGPRFIRWNRNHLESGPERPGILEGMKEFQFTGPQRLGKLPSWWQLKYLFMFTPKFGDDFQFDEDFSNRLKPPTSYLKMETSPSSHLGICLFILAFFVHIFFLYHESIWEEMMFGKHFQPTNKQANPRILFHNPFLKLRSTRVIQHESSLPI